eukprot:COSAG01_NODE_46164_length_402_cov_1.702970_2_plen_61_part_01
MRRSQWLPSQWLAWQRAMRAMRAMAASCALRSRCLARPGIHYELVSSRTRIQYPLEYLATH